MKKLFVFAALLLSTIVVTTSCENAISRKFGGSKTVNLPAGQRLLEVTWKDNSIWYLMEPMDSDYVPKTKTFKEDSNIGVLEGTVTFVESR